MQENFIAINDYYMILLVHSYKCKKLMQMSMPLSSLDLNKQGGFCIGLALQERKTNCGSSCNINLGVDYLTGKEHGLNSKSKYKFLSHRWRVPGTLKGWNRNFTSQLHGYLWSKNKITLSNIPYELCLTVWLMIPNKAEVHFKLFEMWLAKARFRTIL